MKMTLEMVDQVIDRTGATYQDAKEALIKCEGDVLEAIVLLESKEKSVEENLIIKKLKELVEKGKISRILVEKNERNIINIPILAGVIGGIIFSGATVVALTAAILSGCEIYVINDNNERINIKEYTKEKYNEVINKNKKNENENKYEEKEEKEEN
jgi:NACalpha-BTF3-like transcription factor